MEENGDVLDSYGLVGAIGVKNLFGKVSDDFRCDDWTLFFDDLANEFGHRGRQVVLVVKKVNNLGVVLILHIFYLLAVLLHAGLQHVEENLFEIYHFCVLVVVLKEVEAAFQEALYELFFNLLIWPQQVHVLGEDAVDNKLEGLLARY